MELIRKLINILTSILLLLIFLSILFGDEENEYNYSYLVAANKLVKESVFYMQRTLSFESKEVEELDDDNKYDKLYEQVISKLPRGSTDEALLERANNGCVIPSSVLPSEPFTLKDWSHYKSSYKNKTLEDSISSLGIYYCLLESGANGVTKIHSYRWLGEHSNEGLYVVLDVTFGADELPLEVKLNPLDY